MCVCREKLFIRCHLVHLFAYHICNIIICSSPSLTTCLLWCMQLRYLGLGDGVDKAAVEWVVDFSSCGLVIHHIAIKARCSFNNQTSVSLCVKGDDSISVYPQFTGEHLGIVRVSCDHCITFTQLCFDIFFHRKQFMNVLVFCCFIFKQLIFVYMIIILTLFTYKGLNSGLHYFATIK